MDRVTLDYGKSLGVINPDLYGHFSEHIGGVFYDGLWVGEDSAVPNIRGFRKSLVESFRKIGPPVLRWPGGCFAETYDWRDGIGNRKDRPVRVNWWYGCDGRLESNQVGTHEFIDFCRLTGAEPYFAANLTSVPPLHIRDWVEYCNLHVGSSLTQERARNGSIEPFNVRYWGIGNENWGGGGQMTPEMCAREAARVIAIIQSLGLKDLRFILCGPNERETEWTRRLLREWTRKGAGDIYGLSAHYYTFSKDDPLHFSEDGWYAHLFRADMMRRVIDDHRAVMDEFDPQRKIKLIVDEWGSWHRDGSGPSKGYNLFEQQSTLRDSAVAALTLNLFNNRCDVVGMANVAQLCNNLHSLYLAAGDQMIETPTYHVFDMFKTHKGGRQIKASVEAPAIEREGYTSPLCLLSASASEKDGVTTVTLCNLSVSEERRVLLQSGRAGKGTVTVLSAADPHAHNTFDMPDIVHPITHPRIFTGEDAIAVPAAGVVSVVIGA